jgi:hypothetical protein
MTHGTLPTHSSHSRKSLMLVAWTSSGAKHFEHRAMTAEYPRRRMSKPAKCRKRAEAVAGPSERLRVTLGVIFHDAA